MPVSLPNIQICPNDGKVMRITRVPHLSKCQEDQGHGESCGFSLMAPSRKMVQPACGCRQDCTSFGSLYPQQDRASSRQSEELGCCRNKGSSPDNRIASSAKYRVNLSNFNFSQTSEPSKIMGQPPWKGNLLQTSTSPSFQLHKK